MTNVPRPSFFEYKSSSTPFRVASRSGTDRRLGRQYVNGAFSARQAAGLPVCQ
jgi:hypothetical protein